MGVKSLGNDPAAFKNKFARTGLEAVNPFIDTNFFVDGYPYDIENAAYELTSLTAKTVTVSSPLTVNVYAWGGGGGEGKSGPTWNDRRIGGGGSGGAAGGTMTLLPGVNYTLTVGGGGVYGLDTEGTESSAPNGGGSNSTHGYSGGGGGGASSIHTPSYRLVIAGGGGGGGHATNNVHTMSAGGGGGGGTTGGTGGYIRNSTNTPLGIYGTGGTQSSGGTTGPSGVTGGSPPGVTVVASGGDGSPWGAGGGGGYYGGGRGGDNGGTGASGGNGGGGSGYVNPSYLTSTFNTAGGDGDTSVSPSAPTAATGPVSASPYRGDAGNGGAASSSDGGTNSGNAGKIVIELGEPPIYTSGGNVDGLQPGNGYIYHTFTSPGNLTITGSPISAEVLMVAGGGSGGIDGGGGGTGGGGAGGLLHGTLTLTPGTYPITVGADTPDTQGQQGNPTTAFGATANGGGFGRYAGNNDPAPNGGSGGGGCAGSPGGPGGQSNQTPQVIPYGTLVGYGHSGSNGTSGDEVRFGGGGGGAGAAAVSPGVASPGGEGKQYPQFTGTLIGVPSLSPYNGYYAGGGGGGRSGLGSPDGTGGAGSSGTSDNGLDGVTNTGGGGGGASIYPAPTDGGGKGGAGIVVIRYTP